MTWFDLQLINRIERIQEMKCYMRYTGRLNDWKCSLVHTILRDVATACLRETRKFLRESREYPLGDRAKVCKSNAATRALFTIPRGAAAAGVSRRKVLKTGWSTLLLQRGISFSHRIEWLLDDSTSCCSEEYPYHLFLLFSSATAILCLVVS